MPPTKLTDQGIRALPFMTNGQRDYPDGSIPGLSLRIGKSTKAFVYVSGSRTNRKRHTLGHYPECTLGMARERARDIAAHNRLRPFASVCPSYQQALVTFFATYSAQKHRATTRKTIERLHYRHFVPVLGKKRLDGISTNDIMEIIDRLLPTPSEANQAFRAIRTFLRWAVKRRMIERSPIDGIEKPAPEIPRSRVLTPSELVAVWRECDRHPHFGPFVRALILTGQRRGQFAHLRDEMIDMTRQTITWPAPAMKAGKEHTIPYGPMLAEILHGRSGTFFSTARGKLFSVSGSPMIRFRKYCKIEHWTVHDLRRTWATISAEELDTPPHIIEAVLAHQSGTAVARTYNRAKYLPQMRVAMLAFQEWLQALLSNTEGTNGSNASRVRQERAGPSRGRAQNDRYAAT